MSNAIEIAILNGSVRMGRKSPQVAEYLAQKLTGDYENITVNYLDLADFNLPIMQERRGIHPNLPTSAEKLGVELERADALIVVTPEYNGGYPGVLKNALDYYYDEISKKPVGVVSVSSGRMGAIQAWEKLVGLFVKIGAFMANARLHVGEIDKVFDEDLRVTSGHFEKSATKFVRDYLWFVDAILTKQRK